MVGALQLKQLPPTPQPVCDVGTTGDSANVMLSQMTLLVVRQAWRNHVQSIRMMHGFSCCKQLWTRGRQRDVDAQTKGREQYGPPAGMLGAILKMRFGRGAGEGCSHPRLHSFPEGLWLFQRPGPTYFAAGAGHSFATYAPALATKSLMQAPTAH